MLDQGKLLVGIPVVRYVTDIIMRIPPKSFDKAHYAPVVAAIVGILISVIEAMSTKSMDPLSAVLRGLGMAAGAAGVYEVEKNYKRVRTKKENPELPL